MTYRVLRGIGVGNKNWEKGDKLETGDAPEKAIKDWLKIGAIEEVN